jgi:hypothetical protein
MVTLVFAIACLKDVVLLLVCCFGLVRRVVSWLPLEVFHVKQPRCPTTDEWIKKMWYLYTMEFYAAMKKNEMLSFAGKWVEEHHSE